MYERPSFADQAGELFALAREWLGIMMARQVREMAREDPELVRDLRRRRTGYRVTPKYDARVVQERFGSMQKAFGECTEALARTMDGTRGLVHDLGVASAGGATATFDCTAYAARLRAIHGQALLFHLRAAQVLCLVQEIEGAIVFLHECEPDPCAVLPPAPEDRYAAAAYEAIRESERRMAEQTPLEKREEPPSGESGRRGTPPKAG